MRKDAEYLVRLNGKKYVSLFSFPVCIISQFAQQCLLYRGFDMKHFSTKLQLFVSDMLGSFINKS